MESLSDPLCLQDLVAGGDPMTPSMTLATLAPPVAMHHHHHHHHAAAMAGHHLGGALNTACSAVLQQHHDAEQKKRGERQPGGWGWAPGVARGFVTLHWCESLLGQHRSKV